jgi:threonine synthase
MPDYCWSCGSPLEVQLNYVDKVEHRPGKIFEGGVTDIWKYQAFYPLSYSRHRTELYLGEGGTPLVLAIEVGRRMGVEEVWCKCEHLNPSGSFKDRSAAVGVAWAREQGAKGAVCASSGNAAAAAATYAARAGLPVYIVVSSRAPRSKLRAALAHGGRVFRIAGDFSQAFVAAREVATKASLVNLTTTYVNPYACEGNKSVAYELYEQMDRAPDWVVVPVGAGPLLYGVWKGFEELRQFGFVDRIPRMMAVQPEGCAPIVRAFESGKEVAAWPHVETLVSGLDDPLTGYEGDGNLTLSVVRESGGIALAVSDEKTLEAGRLLAQAEGMFVEPAAATSVAAVSEAKRCGYIGASEVVVCLLTGHGLKYQGEAEEVEIRGVDAEDGLVHAIENDLVEET